MSKSIPKGYHLFHVKGNSMLPTLEEGDIVVVSKASNPRIGDIIVFRNVNKKYVIHRVIKINGGTLITKGDNRPYCDHPIIDKDIVGISVRVGKKDLTAGYYSVVNPILATVSNFSQKLYFRRLIPKKLQDLKTTLIGDKDLHLERTALFLINLPYKALGMVYRLR